MKLKLCLWLFISVTLLSSCVDEPTAYDIVNLDHEFEIRLSQAGSHEGMQVQIVVQSVESFTCKEASIETGFSIGDNFFDLIIEEIDIPINCSNDIPTYLKKSIPFSCTSDTYNCVIQVSQLKENNGSLSATGDHYHLILESDNGIKIIKEKIKVLPDGFCWGNITFDKNATPSLSNALVHDLMQNHSSNSSLPEGDYGVLEIAGNRMVTLHDSEVGVGFVFPYLDEAATKSFFSSLEDQFPSLKIEGYFDNGSVYLK